MRLSTPLPRATRRALCLVCAIALTMLALSALGRRTWAFQQQVPSGPLPIFFDECGTVIANGGCRFFFADSGGIYAVSGLGSFVEGDRVHVIGLPEPNCMLDCAPPDGCIANPTLFSCLVGDSICAGDGGDTPGCTPCPCGNDSLVDSGGGGCLNSAGQSAVIEASGNPGVLVDTFRVEVHGATPQSFGALISGANALPAGGMNPCPAGSGIISPLLDGLRCVGGGTLRHGARATDSSGDIGATNSGWGGGDPPAAGLIVLSGFSIGDTRHFQVFYREPPTAVCMTGQNTTNALTVTITL